MKEIVSALIELYGNQCLAVNALADHVGALETLVKRHRLWDDGEFQRALQAEHGKRKADAQQVEKMLAGLREIVSRMEN